MVDVATFLGADPEQAQREMRDVVEFEITLANFSMPRELRRNTSLLYNPMLVRDLSSLDPNTPWLDYINKILTPDIIQVRTKIQDSRVPYYLIPYAYLLTYMGVFDLAFVSSVILQLPADCNKWGLL